MAAPSTLSEVIQSLVQDQNLARIKKLLVYACKQTWETDPVRLNYVNLSDLIQELLRLAPTLDALKDYLHRTVQTLNKPAEYTLIANAIVNHFTQLYADYGESTQIAAGSNSYLEIAQTLQQNPDHIRIKKLLFSACTGTWENDQTRLQAIELVSLIKHLHELTPTLETVKAVLDSIVKTLNRQSEYALVANKIVEAFACLYSDKIEQTQIVAAPVFFTTAYSEPVTPQPAFEPEPVEVLASSVTPPATSIPPDPKNEPINPFDIRVEIMKYTNPLRAKVLLFSLLYHPLKRSDDPWSRLRSQTLDDLVTQLLQTYKTPTQLESTLKAAANRLKESDQYLQAASAILRAVKPYYESTPSLHASEQVSPEHIQEPQPSSDRRVSSDRRSFEIANSKPDHANSPAAAPLWTDDSDSDHTVPLFQPHRNSPLETEQ